VPVATLESSRQFRRMRRMASSGKERNRIIGAF
jgi:hypothetical protein